MIILGIDPGYAILGYGVLEAKLGQRPKPVDYGVIETAADEPFPQRLDKLYLGVRQLIGLYKPEQVAFEELFFYRNVTTALQVGAGRGVAARGPRHLASRVIQPGSTPAISGGWRATPNWCHATPRRDARDR